VPGEEGVSFISSEEMLTVEQEYLHRLTFQAFKNICIEEGVKCFLFRVEGENLSTSFIYVRYRYLYILFYFFPILTSPKIPERCCLHPPLSPAGPHAGVMPYFIPTFPVVYGACSVYRVSQEQRSVFWDAILPVILNKKKLYMYMCPIPNGFHSTVPKLLIKILRTVSNTGIYCSSDKVGTVYLV
jgi:hypothetical protein